MPSTDQPSLEIADVFHEHAARFLRSHATSHAQRRVLSDLMACRTAALGGHRHSCPSCGHEHITYNSCRNRHCPRCQGPAQAAWVDEQRRHLLDVPYFHVVFTLPDTLAPLALQNPRVVYGLLFQAVWSTLRTVASDPRHLGAEIGALAVLHTWTQTLGHHPHVHCVVPGGGLSPDGTRWIACPENFFLPVRVLSRLFRGRLLAALRSARARGDLQFHGQLLPWADEREWSRQLAVLADKEWVVYVAPPFAGPEPVLKYLARYTHRVAISNRRLLSMDADMVRFRWKDRAHGNRDKVMQLEVCEFIRRFLLHVLPKGFVRIRRYGLLANKVRETKLSTARCRIAEALGEALSSPPGPSAADDPEPRSATSDGLLCPVCGQARMIVVADLPRKRRHVQFDTS